MTTNPVSKPIERWFNGYLSAVGLTDAPIDQVRELKRAFFAGCHSMMSACEKVGEPDVPEEAGMEVFRIILEECKAFRDAVVEGSA